jgi:polyisoprenoid-binding protein YceI
VVPGTEPSEDIPKVEERMRGPEVLDVERFPGIRFWSFEIQVEDSEPEARRWRLRVKGGLEIRGKRHTVELPWRCGARATRSWRPGRRSCSSSAWASSRPRWPAWSTANDFRISFEVRARRKGAEVTS